MLWGEKLLWAVASAFVALILAYRGWRKKSLSLSGAIAAFVVGSLTMATGFRFGATLIAFYLSSSQLTKYRADLKKKLEDDFKEGGQRDWVQVSANSATGAVVSLLISLQALDGDTCLDAVNAPAKTALLGAFLGHYAACTADTWASELGILSTSRVHLITSMQVVPRGTNGGVTWLGTFASGAGGAFIGLFFFFVGRFTASGSCTPGAAARQWLLFPLSLTAGLFGSALDSVLGATLQFSGFSVPRNIVVSRPGPQVKRITGRDILSNSSVNFLSSLLTALATSYVALYIF